MAGTALVGLGLEEHHAPVVQCGDGRVHIRPSTVELADCLRIVAPLEPDRVFDVAVVGAGPSGLAAAVYAASEGLHTVVIEMHSPGGQAGTSSRIENYLGFLLGISGMAFAQRVQIQAQKFGARIVVSRRLMRIETMRRPFVLTLNETASSARGPSCSPPGPGTAL